MSPSRWLPIALVLCSGCVAHGPSRIQAPEVGAPDAWQQPAGGALADGWLDRLGNAELQEAIGRAWQANPDFRVVLSRLAGVEAQAALAGAGRFPRVDLQASAVRQKRLIALPVGVTSTTATVFTIEGVVQWELDLWGRVAAGRRAAMKDREATLADIAAARLALAARVAKAWGSQVEAAAQVALAERRLALRGDLLQASEQRFQDGLSSAAQVDRARQALHAARADRRARHEALTLATARFQALLGSHPSGRSALPPLAVDRALSLLAVPDGDIPAGLPSSLLRRRPDLRAAVSRLVGADERRRQALADRFPRLSLTASAGRASSELSDLSDPDFTVWSLVGNILAPLFDGGRRVANQALAAAQVDEAAAAYVAAVQQAFLEVETTLASDTAGRDRLAVQTEALTAAQRIHHDLAQRYRAGLVEVASVTEAAIAVCDQQAALIALQAAVWRNRLDCHLALATEPGGMP